MQYRLIHNSAKYLNFNHHHHHHHISVMELDHLLTRSALTYPHISSKVCHDYFCQLENSVSLPWVIYYDAFYLHVVSTFSSIPVICPKFVLFLICNLCICNLCICFVICPSVSCCSSHTFYICCCYSSGVPSSNGPRFVSVKKRLGGLVYCIILILFS